MKSFTTGFMLLLLVFVVDTGIAGPTLKSYDGLKGRAYHAGLYEAKQCAACHGTNQPTSLPADDVCMKCHGLEKLVAATARPEPDNWQNPHNNLHWGKDVPCMECHGEHQESKPLCQGCHSFKYPNYKP
ncbi:MAG: cytochrome c3 family protein [Chromatiales bacterium]|jgi:DnaJ-class molecular chaperone